ncbi:MAG TPA: cytochrome P450 [Acidimicrobiales bacterium]|nr:cytochrome P450 [Acidimicrobiales bacterium]
MSMRVDELDIPVLETMALTTKEARVEALHDAQQQSWIARNEFGYSILRYEDCVAILRDRRWHQALSRFSQMPELDAAVMQRRPSILTAEGDEHARLRRLVAPAFTPKAADRLRPYMREVVNRLVDPFADSGKCELVTDVCEPYPIPIICRLLGAPEEDWKLFSRWASDLLRIFNNNLIEDLPYIQAAQVEMSAYVHELIERRRTRPSEDLLTDLIAAEEAGDRLDTEELESMATAVLVGGTDTTRNQLACTVALFTGYPDQWKLLAERPELAARATEESMRVLGAIRGTARVATEDIEYKDVLFPENTFVATSFVAANTDELVFVEPEVFDITREGATSPHLTFGSGIHYCLGAWLARAELQEALPILAQRMPDLEVDGEIDWKPESVGIWGPARLPLRFTPA